MPNVRSCVLFWLPDTQDAAALLLSWPYVVMLCLTGLEYCLEAFLWPDMKQSVTESSSWGFSLHVCVQKFIGVVGIALTGLGQIIRITAVVRPAKE